MRRLKFRAWDKYEKKYYYFSIFDNSSKHVYHSKENGGAQRKIYQHTGLQDKNGKDIYEGDILEHNWDWDDYDKDYSKLFEVTWDESNAGFEETDLYTSSATCKIIGNIHERNE